MPTAYVVLRKVTVPIDPDSDSEVIEDAWTAIRTVDAASPGAAIRDVVTTHLDGRAGLYVAVPARSWKPLTVTATTQTIIKLG